MSVPRACAILVLLNVSQGAAQYAVFPADAPARLTVEGAARLAELPLRCIDQEYPNKTGHVIEGAPDARLTPRQLHPAFYGCFDWHSSVHGHWALVRLLKSFPDLPNKDRIREVFGDIDLEIERVVAEVGRVVARAEQADDGLARTGDGGRTAHGATLTAGAGCRR